MASTRSRSRILVEIALFVVIFVGLQAWQSRKVARGYAATVAGVGLRGEPLSTAALRGKPMVLHFWATWCGVCRAEEGTIAKLAREAPMVTVATSSGSAASSCPPSSIRRG